MGNIWKQQYSEKKVKDMFTPVYEDLSGGVIETDPSKAYGGIGELLQSQAPKRNPQKENELKRVAKYAAMTDLFKTIAEGVALTAGQNSKSGAVSSVIPRGENSTVKDADRRLQNIYEQYKNDDKLYNNKLLQQELRESQYRINTDAHNKGLAVQQERDNVGYANQAKNREYQDYTARLRNEEMAKREKDNFNRALAKAKATGDAQNYKNTNKPMFSIYDRFSDSKQPKQLKMYDKGQLYQAYAVLKNKYGDNSPQSKEVESVLAGTKPESEETLHAMYKYITQKLNQGDISDTHTIYGIAGEPSPYEQQVNAFQRAQLEKDQIKRNVYEHLGYQAGGDGQFFPTQPVQTNIPADNYAQQQYVPQNKQEEPFDFGFNK